MTHRPDQQPDDPAARPDPGPVGRPDGTPATWEQVVERFQGQVAEIADALTWGLDLDEETLTGTAGAVHDPSEERFLRSYVSFAGETLDVETLRVPAADDTHAGDIARTALSGALAAPLHTDDADDDFLDSYDEYRAAMRAIVEEVDRTPLVPTSFVVDGTALPGVRVDVRDRAAVYVAVADRAVVVAGPADLLDRVDVVTAPLRAILHGEDEPRF